jgi:hypothetical protein
LIWFDFGGGARWRMSKSERMSKSKSKTRGDKPGMDGKVDVGL